MNKHGSILVDYNDEVPTIDLRKFVKLKRKKVKKIIKKSKDNI